MSRRMAITLVVPFLLAACSASPVQTEQSVEDSGAQTEAEADAGTDVGPGAEKPDLMLFTSLPILWSEGGLGDILSQTAEVHWARTALESRYDLVPIDTLATLPEAGTIVMAQPRALSPGENVALDAFVRAGGRVLLIVDPMLDAHSHYGFGDRRRPEAISMLSPILARWGMRLLPDERGDHIARWGSRDFPVEDGGRFELADGGHDSNCQSVSEGLVAWCRVGGGKVMLMADATFLADGENAGAAGEGLLFDLIQAAEGPATAT